MKLILPARILNAALNMATGGITVRQLAARLHLGLSAAQQAVSTLISQGRLYETRTPKQTSYHTVMTFINRILESTPAQDATYGQVIAHLTKHRNRKWPLRELAQQLGLGLTELTRHLGRAITARLIRKHHVGALALYALD